MTLTKPSYSSPVTRVGARMPAGTRCALAAGLMVLANLDSASAQSVSGDYEVFTATRPMPDTCGSPGMPDLGTLTYTFRGRSYPGALPVPLVDGRFDDRREGGDVVNPPAGPIEWSVTLERRDSVTLGGRPAVVLVFFANHLRGSGSVAHVLVLRCRERRLEVAFEAGGRGVTVQQTGDGVLDVSHPVWRAADAEADPSLVVEERFRWDAASDRYVLIGRSERARPRRN